MRRITLQPIRRFAILAVAAHALLGGLLWWWLTSTRGTEPKPAPATALTWISPADFEPSRPLPPAAAQVTAPAPAPPVTSPPPPAAPPAPPPSADTSIKSMLAVVGTQPPAPSKPLPKAIAIDPAEALALMKAQQESKGEVKPSPAPPPAITAPAPAAPPSPPSPSPAPAVKEQPAATPPPPEHVPAEEPAPISDVSRFITVSRRDPAPSTNAASLLDMASLDADKKSASSDDKNTHLEDVDRAIRNAFMRQWSPPKVATLNVNQRTAHMDMAVDRSGHVLNFKLIKRSGSEDFDLSLLEAANRLDKIPVTLPASFHPDHYEFQLHFHVE